MKRFSNILGRSKNPSPKNTPAAIDNGADTPEGIAARAVRLFCESGSAANRDEEVLHLPTIVDAAESSPGAAAACASQICTFLQKSYANKPHIQYNAIMLVRILSENPGPSFTKNFDDKFVKTVKVLLREGRDMSVQQILRETLDSLEVDRSYDEGVQALVMMWRREKGKYGTLLPQPRRQQSRSPGGDVFGSSALNHGTLPPPSELSGRIEEARNSAKILIQFLQTTPPEEIFSNELIKEFADRCQAASRSMQTYINCDNPAPDDNTLQTLIETNEQLSLANSRHQRAILAARRAMGVNPSPGLDPTRTTSVSSNPGLQQQTGFFQAPPRPQENGFGQPIVAPATTSSSTYSTPTHPNPTYGNFVSPPLASQQPPVSPPRTTVHTHQPSASVDSRVSRPDDYDDLYDSPAVSKPPAARDPFADPVEQNVTRPVSDATVQPSMASATYSPGQLSGSPNAARPGPGPWHSSNITESYVGRQASAANGLTMHAPGSAERAELDSHSNVGRL